MAVTLGFLRRAATSTQQQLGQAASLTPHGRSLTPHARSLTPHACSPVPRTTPTPKTPMTPVSFAVTPSSTGTVASSTMPYLLKRAGINADSPASPAVPLDAPPISPVSIRVHPPGSSSLTASSTLPFLLKRRVTNSAAASDSAPSASAFESVPSQSNEDLPVLLGRTTLPEAQTSPPVASDCSTCVADDSPSFLAEQARSAFKARLRRIATRFPQNTVTENAGMREQLPVRKGMPTLLTSAQRGQSLDRDGGVAASVQSLHSQPARVGTAADADVCADAGSVLTSQRSCPSDVDSLTRTSASQAREAFLERQRRRMGRNGCPQI